MHGNASKRLLAETRTSPFAVTFWPFRFPAHQRTIDMIILGEGIAMANFAGPETALHANFHAYAGNT